MRVFLVVLFVWLLIGALAQCPRFQDLTHLPFKKWLIAKKDIERPNWAGRLEKRERVHGDILGKKLGARS